MSDHAQAETSVLAVSVDGRRIAFHEPAGRLADTWTKGGRNGWLRGAVADAILSGRSESWIDTMERTVHAERPAGDPDRFVKVVVQ